jgi:hypothetical protein
MQRPLSRVWLVVMAGLVVLLILAVILLVGFLDRPVVLDQPTPNLAATLTAAVTAIPQIVP